MVEVNKKQKKETGIVSYDSKTAQFTTKNPYIWLEHYDDIEVIGTIYDKE